jgi:hypothetical protein
MSFISFLDVDYRLYITWIIHQLWGYKVEGKLHLGGTRIKKVDCGSSMSRNPMGPDGVLQEYIYFTLGGGKWLL